MSTKVRARLGVAGLLAGSAALVGGLLAMSSPGSAQSAAPDPLTPEYAALGHVTVDAGNTAQVATAFASDKAVAIAQQEIGGGRTVASIHHGKAAAYINGPVRSVWLVSFTGVQVPMVGPNGGTTKLTTSDLTTVVIDDATGEVLRTFHVSWP